MRCHPIPQGGPRRRGAAVVELALLLPFLTFLLLITIDYCRLFYYSQVVTNCARNGAVFASDPFALTAGCAENNTLLLFATMKLSV